MLLKRGMGYDADPALIKYWPKGIFQRRPYFYISTGIMMNSLITHDQISVSRPFIPLTLGLALGIALADVSPGYYIPAAACLVAAIFIVVLGFSKKPGPDIRHLICTIIIFISLGYISGSQFLICDDSETCNLMKNADGEKKRITGHVSSLPAVYEDGASFILETESIEENQKRLIENKKIRVRMDGVENIPSPGDRLTFIAPLRRLKSFRNPGCFDYERHMLYEGVIASCNVKSESLNVVEPQRNYLIDRVNRFRKQAGILIDEAVPDEAPVMKALITGDTSDISPSRRDAFNRTGAGHLIAISGLNIGIMAAFSYLISRFIFSYFPLVLKRGILARCASFAAIPPVIMYGLISGLEPSALRAVIMAVVILSAGVLSRENDIFNSVAASAFIILALSPGSLFSISFILSYMAVIFLVISAPLTDSLKAKEDAGLFQKSASWIYVSLSVSFFATIGTSPFVIHFFGLFSPVGILANLVLVPLFGIISVAPGLIAVFSLLFSNSLFFLFIRIAAIPVKIGTSIIVWLSEFKYSAFSCISPDGIEVAFLYTIFFSAIFLARSMLANEKNIFSFSKASVWVLCLSITALFADAAISTSKRFFRKDMEISIIDVGHGNSALIELPGGKTMLVDGGGFQSKGSFDTGRDVVAPFLRRKKILKIDYMVMTHPDTDHMKGLIYIAKEFSPEELWKGYDVKDEPEYITLMDIVAEKGMKIRELDQNKEPIVIGDAFFDILNPLGKEAGVTLNSTNDASLVLRMNFCGKSVLFTGDISQKTEKRMSSVFPEKLRAAVLIVPHHGSNGSGSEVLLDAVRPEVAIISTGRKGLPGNDLLQRLEQRNINFWRTDINGCISILINDKTFSIKAFRNV